MNTFFKQFFSQHMRMNEANDQDQAKVNIAAAALLIEVAKADFNMQEEELKRIEAILQQTLNLDSEQLVELVNLAQQESKESTSLHAFTQLIHSEYSTSQKVALFQQLWKVAYADGRLDKYEEYLLRKIADLIYLPHQHFIQTKHRVLEELGLN
jgi:uncharacterized tellurite resistance protein B-like protein